MLARASWKQARLQWDWRRLIFLDETGLNTKMTRLYARAARGQRALSAVPHGHWHTSTFIAALRPDRLTAPLLLDGAMNGEAFLAYLEQVLGPELQPGDRVICDNLSCHKVSGVKAAIERHGATLHYLPAYSPDLNPIEQAFAKLKASLRQAAARTFDGLIAATAQAIAAFEPSHCFNFFRHAQYATN